MKSEKLRFKVQSFLLILLIAGIASSLLIKREEKRIERLWDVRKEKEAEVERLAELSIKYPDYRDLLYRLAVVQMGLGNEKAASAAVERAVYLDPNNEMAEEIRGIGEN